MEGLKACVELAKPCILFAFFTSINGGPGTTGTSTLMATFDGTIAMQTGLTQRLLEPGRPCDHASRTRIGFRKEAEAKHSVETPPTKDPTCFWVELGWIA